VANVYNFSFSDITLITAPMFRTFRGELFLQTGNFPGYPRKLRYFPQVQQPTCYFCCC
jgi:hypothetical protein